MQLILLYVVLSLAVAIYGANRKFGFWGYFFGSLLLSPALGFILVLASDKNTK